jgi:hypothetical protein
MPPPILKMFKGPFKGVEMRDAYQTDQHLELAINVNLSRGYLEPRPGKHAMSFRKDNSRTNTNDYLDNLNYNANPRVHLIERPTADTWLLVVGPRISNQLGAGNEELHIEAQAFNLDTNTKTTYLMPTGLQGAGEPYDKEFNCSFADVFLPGGRAATLICTGNTTHVFSPNVAESPEAASSVTDDPGNQYRLRGAAVRFEAVGGGKQGFDATLVHEIMFSYAENAPAGSIVEAHAGMVFYAGFDGQHSLVMQSRIDNLSVGNPHYVKAEGDNVPVNMIDNQYSVILGKHMFCWSDINDPLAVNETAFGTVDYGQEITGLKSFNDVLFIFTKRSTYGFVGGIDPSQSKVWKVNNVGCTAQNTPVVAGEKVFWINDNGIWQTDGPKTSRISDPIGKLFSDEEDSGHVPRAITEPLMAMAHDPANAGDYGLAAGLGYPWKVDKRLLHLATSVHNPIHSQVWFNVPIISSLRRDDTGPIWEEYEFHYGKHINSLTIVYNYELEAFSFYVDGSFARRNFCSDAAYWPERNQMIIACTTKVEHTREGGSHAGQFTASLETFPHSGQDWATPMYGKGWIPAGGGGVTGTDLDFRAARRTVPYAWCSARLFKDNEDYVDIRRPRLTMLSYGHRPQRHIGLTGGGSGVKAWGPLWFLEVEPAAFEQWKDNNTAAGLSANDGAFSQEGYLECHPRAYDNAGEPGGFFLNKTADEVQQPAYFWSGVNTLGGNGDLAYGKWDDDTDMVNPSSDRMVWGEADWFDQQLHYPEGNLLGKSVRLGVIHPDFWLEDSAAPSAQGFASDEDTAPSPVGVVASFSFEVQRAETTR